MIATGHTSVGVVVGVVATQALPDSIPPLGQVLLVGTIGVISHFVMDVMPHGHYDFDASAPTRRGQILLLVDLLLPIVVVLSLCLWRWSWSDTLIIFFGIGGSQLPDIFDGLFMRGWFAKYGWAQFEHRFHMGTHWHNPTNPTRATPEGGRKLGLGDVWQLLTGLIALCLLVWF
jgi:hypothetical protein